MPLRSDLIRIASGLSKGDPTRRQLLAALRANPTYFDFMEPRDDLVPELVALSKRAGFQVHKVSRTENVVRILGANGVVARVDFSFSERTGEISVFAAYSVPSENWKKDPQSRKPVGNDWVGSPLGEASGLVRKLFPKIKRALTG